MGDIAWMFGLQTALIWVLGSLLPDSVKSGGDAHPTPPAAEPFSEETARRMIARAYASMAYRGDRGAE
jgi:hypothetical protein